MTPAELGPISTAIVENFNDVSLVDSWTVSVNKRLTKPKNGWVLKPFAIQHSGFSDVILLDADNAPARDPSEIFGWPEYDISRAVFWTDPKNQGQWDTGQIAVNKPLFLPELKLTENLGSDPKVEKVTHGDRDWFRMAWVTSRKHIVSGGTERSGVWFQPDRYGAPLFQHRIATFQKWSLDSRPNEVSGFQHQQECFDLLNELRHLIA